MFLKELWEINPLKLFFETTQSLPGITSNAKIVVFLESVSTLLLEKIRQKKPYFRSLEMKTQGNKILIEGEADAGGFFFFRLFRIQTIHYHVRMKILSIQENVVRFQITSYSLDNPSWSSWDPIRIFARLDPFHKRKILQSIVDSSPQILKLTPIMGEILFDLNTFLEKVPSTAGKIAVLSADLQNNRVVFHVNSFVILKPLMDLLGPEYIKVTYREKGKYY